MSQSRKKSNIWRPGLPSGQNLGKFGQPDPVWARIHRNLKFSSGLAPRKIRISGSSLYRDNWGSWSERTLACWDLSVSNPNGSLMMSCWLQNTLQGVGCHDECGEMPALFSSYSHIHWKSCPCTGICVPAVTARQHATPSHQENLKFLDWTWAALKRLLRTFQGHFFQDRSRQVIPLILCLVCLESLIVLLTNHQET